MTNPRDLFGSGGGGGAFPKIDEFEHKLILLRPSKVEQVPKPARFGGKPGEMQDRLTADVVVFDEKAGTWDEVAEDMYFSQVGIVNPCKKALKPTSTKPVVLGVVKKVPSKIGKDAGLDTSEKIYEAYEEWRTKIAAGKKAEEPNYAWGLVDFTDEQADLAMKYMREKSPLASGAEG
jgi:hypothetical protein